MPPTQIVRSAPDAWRWVSLPQEYPVGTPPSLLARRGYQLLGPEQVTFASIVAGQFGRLFRAEPPNAPSQLWVHRDDLACALIHPVALGVRVPEAVFELFPVGTLDLLTRRPPPMLGEVALIAEDDGWRDVSSAQLEAEDQVLLARLGDRLRVLWGTSSSGEHAHLLWICRVAGGYELQRHVWISELAKYEYSLFDWRARRFPWNKESRRQRQRLQARLELLDQVHQAVQMPLPPAEETERERQWADVRAMAQMLSAAYARVGRPASRVIERPYVVSALPMALPDAPSEGSQAPAQTITIPSDAVNRGLLWALRDRRRYLADTAHDLVRCELPLSLPEREGRLIITLPASSQAELGEHLLVSWLAMVSLVLLRHQKELTSPVGVTSKDILAQSRLALSHGDFKAEQYRRLIQEVEALAQMQIGIVTAGLSNSQKSPIFCPLLHVTLAEKAPGRRRIAALALGNWIRHIPDFPTQTCALPAKLFDLTSHAFRLGLELALAFSTNARGIDIPLGKLLDRAGIVKKPDNPQETLEWIESAFEQLVKARILADLRHPSLVPGSTKGYYRYRWLGEQATVLQAQKKIEGRWRGSNWWETYLAQVVHFDPPRAALDVIPAR